MSKLWRWGGRAALLLIGIILVYQLWIFAHVLWWNFFNPSSSAFMDVRLELLQAKNPDAALRHKWVPYKKISMNLKRALVASEDANFTEHEGFDWEAMQKAYEKNLRKGKVVAGGSTISQQLAKNLFLSGKRSVFRKLQEAIITVMMASCSLRKTLRLPERNRFLASCWLMVEPPATMRPFLRFFS